MVVTQAAAPNFYDGYDKANLGGIGSVAISAQAERPEYIYIYIYIIYINIFTYMGTLYERPRAGVLTPLGLPCPDPRGGGTFVGEYAAHIHR